MIIPTIKVTFDKPMHGWWDYGAKSGGTFKPEGLGSLGSHPGRGNYIRWGCWELNFWFICKAGRTWAEAASIAAHKLTRMASPSCKIEIVR